MSEHARDRENANSAVLVQVHTDDFGNDPRLGIQLQEKIEKKAFEAAHHTYLAPAQRVEDFLQKKTSMALGNVRPSYALGVTLANLHDILPDYVCEAMVEGIQAFDHKLQGFAMADALLLSVLNVRRKIVCAWILREYILVGKVQATPVGSYLQRLTACVARKS